VPQFCRLQVMDQQVKDMSGNPVVLHGATLPALYEMEATESTPQQRLRALADAGARVVRLTVDERDITPTFVPAKLSPFIDQANALGMLVILSYHNNPALSVNAQADNAEDWLRLAIQYLRNAPGVWFEPLDAAMNSPKYQGVAQRMVDVANGYRADNVFVIRDPIWLKGNSAGLNGRAVAHSVAAPTEWPSTAAPFIVVSSDIQTLQAAATTGSWAIADSDAVSPARAELWRASVPCR
jgi:hypothetical protein